MASLSASFCAADVRVCIKFTFCLRFVNSDRLDFRHKTYGRCEMEKVKLFESKKVLAVYIICNALTVFTVIWEIVATLVFSQGTTGKMFEHIVLCAVAIALYNLPLILRMKAKLQIPSFLQIIITVFIIAHFVFGEIFRLYDYSLVFDKILHTTSGVIFGICGFSLINGLNNREKPLFKLSPFFVVVFSLCFSLAIGYIWEIFEFAADSIVGTNAQRWQDSFYTAIVDGEEVLVAAYGQGKGLIDTMGDMIVNLAGAAIISLLGYVWLKKKSKKMDNILIKRIVFPKKAVSVNQVANDEIGECIEFAI